MHGDLSSHLHSKECNDLISELQKCHQEQFFGKWVGACNQIDVKVRRCLKNERLERQTKNNEAAAVKHQLFQERLKGKSGNAQ